MINNNNQVIRNNKLSIKKILNKRKQQIIKILKERKLRKEIIK